MKIISLVAENIKKLIAVEIKPDGSLVQITGRNGQGKTSVLDSIWWALTGAKNIQVAPIRKGANQATIKLDLGELLVKRTFKRDPDGPGFTTKLEVAGAVKGSPQAVLDSLLDSLAFDPLKFARMDPKDQFDALKKFVPGVDFDKIAAANSIDMSNRKELNRRAKEERIVAEQINVSEKTPKERIDETALVAQLADAGKHNADVQMRAENRRQAALTIELKGSLAAKLRKDAQALLDEAEKVEVEAKDLSDRLAAAPPLPEPINVDELQAKITEARSANMAVASREKKAGHEKTAAALEADAKALTDRMEKREDEKRAAIAAAKLPVESITFGDDVVLLNGVPFDQGSDAEQLRASCALAMAGNPDLRVIRVRDGSLLDEEGLQILAKMAEERDFQVWVETVSDGKRVGFCLEDGQLVNAETEAMV